MRLLEETPYDLRLPLAATQVRANIGHHFDAVAGAALPQAIGLDVLVEQLIGVKFRAVSGQADQAQSLLVGAEELLGCDRAMHRVTIDDQIELARRVLDQGKRLSNRTLPGVRRI